MDQYTITLLEDVPDAFSNPNELHHKKNCEIIRKPFLTDLSYKSTY